MMATSIDGFQMGLGRFIMNRSTSSYLPWWLKRNSPFRDNIWRKPWHLSVCLLFRVMRLVTVWNEIPDYMIRSRRTLEMLDDYWIFLFHYYYREFTGLSSLCCIRQWSRLKLWKTLPIVCFFMFLGDPYIPDLLSVPLA